MKRLFLLFIPLIFMACSTVTFTANERQLIGNSPAAETMRLWITDNETDSLFLREKAEPLNRADLKSEWFPALKVRMLATVNDPANPGVGIAAPQVGIGKQLVTVQRLDKEGEPFEFYINPRIENYSEEIEAGPEGCLSIPGRSGVVKRSTSIVISYINEATGRRKKETIEGFTAVIFQHEIDHLDGILYIDRME